MTFMQAKKDLPLGIDAILHHFRREDLGEHDMQSWRLVVPVISVVITGPRLQLAI